MERFLAVKKMILSPRLAEPEYTFEEAAQLWGPPMTHWRLRHHARRRELKVIVYGPRTKRIRYSDLLKLRERVDRKAA
jgi:hypothetical protein